MANTEHVMCSTQRCMLEINHVMCAHGVCQVESSMARVFELVFVSIV